MRRQTNSSSSLAARDGRFRATGPGYTVLEPGVETSLVTAYFLVTADTGEPARFPHCPIDLRLADGEELHLGNKVLDVIHTPGHTPGSACFLLQARGKNILFSGNTVLYDGRLGWQGNPYADNRQYLSSLEKLNHFTLNSTKVQ